MKKIIRLTESDLARIVKRVIQEQEDTSMDEEINYDIKAVNCEGSRFGNTSSVMVDDNDTIVIRYCKGDDEELEYLKEKGKRLLYGNYGMNESEGPFNIGHADYQKNWDKFNDEMEQESKDRKYHIPDYDPRNGRSWTNKSLREYVFEKFGAQLPRNFSLEYTDKISNWLKKNGY